MPETRVRPKLYGEYKLSRPESGSGTLSAMRQLIKPNYVYAGYAIVMELGGGRKGSSNEMGSMGNLQTATQLKYLLQPISSHFFAKATTICFDDNVGGDGFLHTHGQPDKETRN